MRPVVAVSLGILLLVGGVLYGLLNVGVYFIADCGPDCVARGERAVVAFLAVGSFALAGLGAWLVAAGVRKRRRPT